MVFPHQPRFPGVFRAIDALSQFVSAEIQSGRSIQATDNETLDTMESKVCAILADIRTARNATQNVNQLPLETMTRIFSYMLDLVPSADTIQFQEAPSFYSWTVATQVCRRWRDAALTFPDVWNTVDTRHLNAARVFLDRSHQSSIDVYLRNPSRPGRLAPRRENESLKILLTDLCQAVSRIRSLHIGALDIHNDLNSIALFQAPNAPLLESLSLCVETNRSSNASQIVLFGGETPLLTHLTIGSLGNWPKNRFTNLTQFCYSEQVNSPEELVHLADLLRDNPGLEELFLGNSRGRPSTFQPIEENHTTGVSPIHPIHLPNLRKLAIWNYKNIAVAQVTPFLRLPQKLHIKLWEIFCDPGLCSIEHMFSPATNNFLDLRDVREISIERLDFSNIIITCIGPTRSYHIKAYTIINSSPSKIALFYKSLEFLARTLHQSGSQLTTLWIWTRAFQVCNGLLDIASLRSLTTLIIRADVKHTGAILDRFDDLAEKSPSIHTVDMSFISDSELDIFLIPFLRKLSTHARRRLGRLILTIQHRFDDFDEDTIGDRYVEEVEVRHGMPPRRMDLPDVCTLATHTYWPSWRVT